MPAAVIIPTLNEAERIGGLLAQLAKLRSELVVEIIVTDGGSTDATRAIAGEAALTDPRVRVIDNPARIQSAGINLAVAKADRRADIIVRIDAHAFYPDDFVPRIVAAFAATSASMVSVGLRTIGLGCMQRGVAAASNSRIGTGGAAHRVGGPAGFVDHGHHAGIDRAMFERLGGYDESFIANEDAEFDRRVRAAGGRIWLASELQVDYLPRATLGKLFKQYRRYGQGRAQNYRKHGERLRARQMLPPVLVVALVASLLLAVFWLPALLLPALYLLGLAAASLALFVKTPEPCTLLAGAAAATMHMAWGSGFLAEIFRGPDLGDEAASRVRSTQAENG
ncbi:glycosyltransferase family 2 protein [Glacieibacterium sp.]|uniref:glycosyltransferase family 2 protein n=1 Tax=Glacieibacterium sp. TaxID=2860237 RepID=UPI003B00E9BB